MIVDKCEKCNKEFDIDNVESKWFDDDEENGKNLWLVDWICPNCKHENNFEIWI